MESNPTSVATETESVAFDTKVSNILKEAKVSEEGKLVLPEDIDEQTKYGVLQTKRYRDTQASFTKGQQRLKSLEAENKSLMEQLKQNTKVSLDSTIQEELEELKHSDPDKWRVRLNEEENKVKVEQATNFNEITAKASQEASLQFELDRRAKVLEEFNKVNDIVIDDNMIQFDVPPRITNKLESGKISFEEFLDEVNTYVRKPKVVNNPEVPYQPNLNHAGGSSTPPKATESDFRKSYKNTIF